MAMSLTTQASALAFGDSAKVIINEAPLLRRGCFFLFMEDGWRCSAPPPGWVVLGRGREGWEGWGSFPIKRSTTVGTAIEQVRKQYSRALELSTVTVVCFAYYEYASMVAA